MTQGFDCKTQLKKYPAGVQEAFRKTNYRLVYDRESKSENLAELQSENLGHDLVIVLSPGATGLNANGNLTKKGHAEIKRAFDDLLYQLIWENAFARPSNTGARSPAKAKSEPVPA